MNVQWQIQDYPWGRGPCRGGRGVPRQLRFKNFVCQKKESGPLGGRGGVRRTHPPQIRQ